MPENALSFSDSAAYERFMGRWSRSVGPIFLQWLAAPPQARWLDVGCGTGIFTELILDTCSPGTVDAVDSSAAQMEHASRLSLAERVEFRVADAQSLPFGDSSFDIVVSALVINFISDPPRAVSEMRRVARRGATVAGYVWDFAEERSPSWPMRAGMRKFGMEIADVPGTQFTSPRALASMFEQAGLQDIVSRPIEVTNSFPGFDAFWEAQTPGYMPTTAAIAAMPDIDRRRLMATVRGGLPLSADGQIQYSARANAIRARVP